MKKAFFICSFISCILAVSTAKAIIRPEGGGSVRNVPDLLSDYEKQVLRHELADLMGEISVARKAAAALPEMDGWKDALAQAKDGGDAAAIAKASRNLANAVEAKLYEDPEFPKKVKRLMEVGALLEYDTPQRKRERSTMIAVLPKREEPQGDGETSGVVDASSESGEEPAAPQPTGEE